MCGRFSLQRPIEEMKERFRFELEEERMVPRYNIAPTQSVLTVVETEKGRFGKWMRWGLIPFWAKDPKIGSRLINARGETLEEKPSFRHSFRKKRCLILADGFYEWKETGGKKQPYRFCLKNEEPFAFAGLWDVYGEGDGKIFSCTIVTTFPNPLLARYHDRMPVILTPEAEEIWLASSPVDPEALKEVLRPYPMEDMVSYPVSPLVNSPRNDVPEVMNPVDREEM